ncbi:paraquat-inducible protein B [Pseudacidovorax intermedius]|uniref:Paraquat-inducible protein B n=1 Tax=Pseudacidovorax intermedius TaxID=433924 RepID=A0A370F8P8_9BURK|nr:MlaD family protein [Pseudacidovorax intermedius]RDI20054.1 paraquat-inducible protein B [Pseudacidovorax intermedius]
MSEPGPREGQTPADAGASAAPPALARPRVVRRRDWVPSLIWLIPVVAAMVGITLVAKVLWNRGPEIVLTFKTAEGLEAGKTAVKYKDVQIGTVHNIRLARDRSHVRVTVELDKNAAEGFTAKDARYWVVRPRFDTSGVSGLNTLLSGAYIGADAGAEEETASEFAGLEAPPIVTRDASGRQFQLHSRDAGSLDIGSPVYFRRVRVGQVASVELDGDGRGVALRVFIDSPYDRFIGANTRFWHASGLQVQAGASGFEVRTQSLASIVLGGIAFAAPDDVMGPPADENSVFALADDETTAMKPPDGPPQTLLMYFNQSLRGLAPGAPVDFRGVIIGEVKSIGVQFDRNEREFLMPVVVTVYPDRLRRSDTRDGKQAPLPVEPRFTQQERTRFLIGRGLRAQLRTGNLLTGQLYVALDFFPKEKPVKVDTNQDPIQIPTVAGSFDELQEQLQEIATKVNKIPFQEIAGDLRKTLATLDKTLGSAEATVTRINNDVTPEIAAAVKDARKTIDAATRTLSEDAPVQQDLRATLQELTRAAGSVRVLTDYLERHPESLLRGKPEDKKR